MVGHLCRNVLSYSFSQTLRSSAEVAFSQTLRSSADVAVSTYTAKQRREERIRQHIPAEMTNIVATHAASPVRKKRGQPKKSSPTTLRRSQRLAQKEQVLSAVKPDLPAVQMALCKSDSAITRHLKSSTSCLNAVCGDVNAASGFLPEAGICTT